MGCLAGLSRHVGLNTSQDCWLSRRGTNWEPRWQKGSFGKFGAGCCEELSSHDGVVSFACDVMVADTRTHDDQELRCMACVVALQRSAS